MPQLRVENFLLLRDLLFPFCSDVFCLTGVKGLEFFIFMAFPLFYFVVGYFLLEGRKGLHPSAPWAVRSHMSCLVPPVGVDTIHHPNGHLHINPVLWDGTVKVVKVKIAVALEVEIHYGKVFILSSECWKPR